MNSEFYEKEVPVLSREDAIAILNTPDEELDVLIDRAKSLRYRYKGNRVSIHILTNARSGNIIIIQIFSAAYFSDIIDFFRGQYEFLHSFHRSFLTDPWMLQVLRQFPP